jgi:hypothetical protein
MCKADQQSKDEEQYYSHINPTDISQRDILVASKL